MKDLRCRLYVREVVEKGGEETKRQKDGAERMRGMLHGKISIRVEVERMVEVEVEVEVEYGGWVQQYLTEKS